MSRLTVRASSPSHSTTRKPDSVRLTAHDRTSQGQRLPDWSNGLANGPGLDLMAEASRWWGVELEPERSRRVADSAVTYARDRGIERAVVDERALLRDALKHAMDEAQQPEIEVELEKRIAIGEMSCGQATVHRRRG